MHARDMFGWKNCRLTGLVKGGKGLRHHEVLIAFSVRAALQRVRRGEFSPRRFNPAPSLRAREILGK